MGRIFVFGQSHTQALKEAVIDYVPQKFCLNFDIQRMVKEKKNGTIIGDLTYKDALILASEMSHADLLAVSLLGNGHNLFGLTEHNMPFCLSDKDSKQSTGCSNRHLIPFNLMSDMFLDLCKKNKRIPALKNITRAKMVHLIPPPPKGDNDYIKSIISNHKDKMIAFGNINPAEVRLKLWHMEMAALSVVCDNLGIGVVPPPEEAINSEGFLKEDFYYRDATHANSKYGQLVLSQLVKLLPD